MSTDQGSFDFGAAAQGDAFHPAQQEIAPKGNYVFTIVEVEGVRTSSSNAYPMIKLRLECPEGVQWDNLVISPNEFSLQKVLGLIDSAGLTRPVVGTDMDPKDGALSDQYLAKLHAKKVGGIVRDETEVDNRPDSRTRGQQITRPRIKGYVKADALKGVGPAPATAGAANPVQAANKAAEDIPF